MIYTTFSDNSGSNNNENDYSTHSEYERQLWSMFFIATF